MSKRWRFTSILLVALLGLLSMPGTTAAAPGGTTTERYDLVIPVSWEMTPERCPRLNATTRGSGELRENVIITRYADGSIKVVVSDIATGDAEDDNGVRYGFSYKNHLLATIPAPPNNDRVYVQMSDLFSLNGGGPGASAPFTIGLVWRWNYTNSGDIPPFVGLWPPERDLVKVATIGDFVVIPNGLDCDPI